jgi:hypothetical protein
MSPDRIDERVELTNCLYHHLASWWSPGSRQRSLTWRSSEGDAPQERRCRWRGQRGHDHYSCGCESLQVAIVSSFLTSFIQDVHLSMGCGRNNESSEMKGVCLFGGGHLLLLIGGEGWGCECEMVGCSKWSQQRMIGCFFHGECGGRWGEEAKLESFSQTKLNVTRSAMGKVRFGQRTVRLRRSGAYLQHFTSSFDWCQ